MYSSITAEPISASVLYWIMMSLLVYSHFIIGICILINLTDLRRLLINSQPGC